MGDIEFELCGKQFIAIQKTTSNGKPMWRYPATDENELKEIDPLADELPESISIAGELYQFGPVPKKGNNPTATKSLSKTREVRTSAVIEDMEVEIHTRVTKRKNGKWYFWLHINLKRSSLSQNAGNQSIGNREQAASASADDALEKLLQTVDPSYNSNSAK